MSFNPLGQNEYFQEGSNPYPMWETQNMSSPSDVFTINGSLAKTFFGFFILLVGGVVGWMIPGLLWPALIVGLVLGLVLAFKSDWANIFTVPVYAFVEGMLLGALSVAFETLYPGLVAQVVLATLSVFFVMLLVYKSGIIKVNQKFYRIFLLAALGYMVFGLINLGLMLFNVTDGIFGLYSTMGWFGVALSAFGAGLAAFSLVSDFDLIQNAAEIGAPKKLEWFATYGLIASLVWLYIEFLRLFALVANLTR